MAGREQHPRHRQHPFHPLRPQLVEPVAQNRPGKLQVAVLHRHMGQQQAQTLCQLGEFRHGLPIAAAMAADHHADRTTLRGLNVQLCWGVCHGEACLERPYRPPNEPSIHPHPPRHCRPTSLAMPNPRSSTGSR